MKPQQAGTGEGAALCLRKELVAALQRAFQVAVEIAVQEVTKLVSRATEDHYDDMRRENEFLRERLRLAEAVQDSVRTEEEERGGGSPPHTKELLVANDHTGQQPDAARSQEATDPKVGNRCVEVRGEPPPAEHKHRNQEQTAGGDSERHDGGDGGGSPSAEAREKVSRGCVVGTESVNRPHVDRESSLHPSEEDKPAVEKVTVKQEKGDEEMDSSICCLDSIKIEDFSPERMLEVQSKMLEEWKPEVDIQIQNSATLRSCTGQAQDLPSLSTDFPNIFQQAEPVPILEVPPQVHGVHVRTNRHTHACKHCGQTFHLPSLLRRHHGQCPQKLPQCYQQPAAGSRRRRLQQYPPGCSPFRCAVCNREFNRMENLKTHLRIHTGERPYTCSVCSKCFRHSGALTRHFRIHTGEKPYICGQCGKSFRNCGGLRFHQRSHSKQLQ